MPCRCFNCLADLDGTHAGIIDDGVRLCLKCLLDYFGIITNE
ncbi:hypothetical protein DCCM_3633 [Desulfocucumis palustris]|uniref:Uncharacterized protein n=1 Tax=Desulfocucumis palustris TaxID=1898651 RepID=A0A2L2XE60_9FIRM|nr:hypothetical protein [Desulfocucumis palustris]GBF34515.1 hypothetical protein DCCM_3633 [Desulfocucumis palustris]